MSQSGVSKVRSIVSGVCCKADSPQAPTAQRPESIGIPAKGPPPASPASSQTGGTSACAGASSAASSSASSGGYFAELSKLLLHNVAVQVVGLEMIYEDDLRSEHRFTACLRLDAMHLHAADEQWRAAFVAHDTKINR